MNPHAESSQPLPKGAKADYTDESARALLAGQIDLLRVPRADAWTLVKQNDSRSVYRGQIDGQELYLKHYHPQSLARRLARAMGFSDARRELTFSRYLSSRGVETTPALVAYCNGTVEFLVSRAVAPAEPADAWHLRQLAAGEDGRKAIQRAIRQLAGMVGRMHAAGVIHRDLHCGNLLVRTDGAAPRLVLTDLHRMTRRRRLGRRVRAANLAQLLHDRFETTTRTERLRFLTHYLRASGADGTLRGWQILVEEFARRHRHRQYAQRDRRILGRNRYFAPLSLSGGWRGHVVLASKRRMAGSQAAEVVFDPSAWKEALKNPDVLFSGEGVEVIKDSPSSLVVRRTLRVGEHSVPVFLKRPRRKYAWKLLIDCCRAARPLRAFRLGHMLLARRIPTALPLAAIQRRVGPILLDSILVTEAVDAPHLHRFLNTWLSNPPRGDAVLSAPQQRMLAQDVLWQLGRTVQRLHDNNFAHRDLKATNLLVRWSTGEPPELVLVDLDGLSRKRLMTLRRRFQGLMRLNVSLLKCPVVNHAGRLRMLLGYLRRPGCGRINFKPYWRVLEQWSADKINRQIHSRRKRQKAVRRPGA